MKTPEEILDGVILTDLPKGIITEEMTTSIIKAMRIYAQQVAKNLHKPPVSRSKNGGAKKNFLKGFSIKTFDKEAYLTFLTEAKDKRGALKNLLKNSWDFKNCTNDEKDWVIKIKREY